MASRRQRPGAILGLVLVLFFLSGFAALIYQIIWQRLLGFFSGIDIYSVTITVAAFMAGLGCGSAAGGQLADRLSTGARLLAFAIAEAAIAFFALASKSLYYDLLYARFNGLASSPVLLALILFASLVLPTFCMGATLPILAKEFTARIEIAPSVIGYLYGANTLGAAAGAFVTPWVFLRHFGFEDILKVGAGLNATCAIGAILVWRSARSFSATPAPPPVQPEDSLEPARFSPRSWMLIYALSGFIALALEMVWFRILGVAQKSTAFTFPTLLGVYLGGLGLGIIIGVPLAKRVRRPATIFLALQSGVTLSAGAVIGLLLHQVNRREALRPLWVYLGSFDPVNAADIANWITAWFSGTHSSSGGSGASSLGGLLYFILPIILIAPSTFFMGLSFPVLQRLVQNNPILLGRRVGWLQTLNILGSMLGAVIVGWLFLQWLGTAGTLRLLVLFGSAFLFLLVWVLARPGWRRVAATAASLVAVSWIVAAVPDPNKFWARLHGADAATIVVREDRSGVAVLKPGATAPKTTPLWVFLNGLGQSWLPYGSGHTQIGLLAVALHPRPEKVAVIGLGSGDTAYALAGSPQTREISVIEIAQCTHTVLGEIAPRLRDPALDALLHDPRIRRSFTDGRAYILRSAEHYDVIEADALRPNSSFSGNLYSWEYFAMLKAHLKPDGLAVSWAPTPRVLASFRRAFPHVIVVNGIAVGSQGPIQTEKAMIEERLANPFTVEHFERLHGKIDPLISDLLAGKFERYSASPDKLATTDVNSDLFPKDEYMIPPRP